MGVDWEGNRKADELAADGAAVHGPMTGRDRLIDEIDEVAQGVVDTALAVPRAAEEAGAAGRDFRHYVVQIEVSSSVASEDDGESEGRARSDQSRHEDLTDGRSA